MVVANERGVIVLANSHAESLFGYPRAALPGRPIDGLVTERCRARLSVLVVEDADELRRLVSRQLQRHGYTVLVAADADDALALFERNPTIDVLLTDVVMPGASGPELTRQLLERRPELKVVYMSGYPDEALDHDRDLARGVAFLPKPFTSEALGRTIRHVLDRQV